MKNIYVNIRMSEELKNKLAELAQEQQRSLSSQIVYMLSQQTHTPKQVRDYKLMEIPNGVSEQTWADFRKLRAAKKAPVTDRAIDGINREAMKAGMTLEAALQEMCARGWAGFKAEWVQNKHDQVAALLKPSTPYLEMS